MRRFRNSYPTFDVTSCPDCNYHPQKQLQHFHVCRWNRYNRLKPPVRLSRQYAISSCHRVAQPANRWPVLLHRGPSGGLVLVVFLSAVRQGANQGRGDGLSASPEFWITAPPAAAVTVDVCCSEQDSGTDSVEVVTHPTRTPPRSIDSTYCTAWILAQYAVA